MICVSFAVKVYSNLMRKKRIWALQPMVIPQGTWLLSKLFDKVALNLPKKSVSLSLLKKKKKERTFVDFWEYPTNTYFLNLLWDTTIIQEFKKKIIGCICIINFWTSLFHQYISLSQSIKEKKKRILYFICMWNRNLQIKVWEKWKSNFALSISDIDNCQGVGAAN